MLLGLEPTHEPCKLAGRSNHAMTRRDDRNRIFPVRSPDSAHRFRPSDLFRDLSVRSRLAERDRAQCSPDLVLKCRSGEVQLQRERLARSARWRAIATGVT